MAIPKEYQEKVLDEVSRYAAIWKPVKASLAERMLVHKTKTEHLHPNPEDEFCDPHIGPNYGIISEYEAQIQFNKDHMLPPLTERLIVGKMSTGGYILMNGHHRWYAALRNQVRELPIEIVNIRTAAEIISAVDSSEKTMCASFDLDEVLLTEGKSDGLIGKLSGGPKKQLRKNAAAMVERLQAQGFDVWVYTGGFTSADTIERLFAREGAKVDGVVNGMKGRKSNSSIRQAFTRKYAVSLHVDNESILCVNTRSKDYESVPVSEGDAWANGVVNALDNLKILKEYKESGR